MKRWNPHTVQTAKHVPDRDQKVAQAIARQQARALPTCSSRWRRIRSIQLQREPLCRDCIGRGTIEPATEVDHINNDSADNRPENLQSMCKPCHARKTVREDGGFGRGVGKRKEPLGT